ncbi:hypothetical protein ACIRU3_45365 [Streptomyces sp. NPDC101151]
MLVLAQIGGSLRPFLMRPRVNRRIQCLTGIALTALGIGLLVA